MPYLMLGVVLVVACATGGVLAGTRLGDRENVIALTRAVTVGQVLTPQDLGEVTMATDSTVDALPASAAASVAGQPVAYDLPAGSLVTRSVLGAPLVPRQGTAIVAVGLKPGQVPPALAPGTTVAVVTTPSTDAGTGTPAVADAAPSWIAVVTGIDPVENEQTTVVSLQLSESDARGLAATPAGSVSLVAVARGGR